MSWLEEANKINKSQAGVYYISNMINGKIYVGISTDLKGRLRTHYHKLYKNKHHNKHLQNSVNQYGIGMFFFKIIESLPHDINEQQLLIKEHSYQILYKSTNSEYGYNILLTDITGSIRHTEEHKLHMSQIMTNRTRTEQHCHNISVALTGQPGHPHTEEHKLRVSVLFKGKPKTEEHRKKLSIAKTGKPSLNKGRKLGPISEERRLKCKERTSGAKNLRAVKIKDKNGNLYSTIGEATLALKICRTTVEKRIKNGSLERCV